MKALPAIIAGFGCLVAMYALAEYPGMKSLTGQFDVVGRHPIDPPPDEPPDTHFRVYLTGDAAKTLFEQMKVQAAPVLCGYYPDAREKRIGSMLCSTENREYECFFAINIQTQIIEGGWAC